MEPTLSDDAGNARTPMLVNGATSKQSDDIERRKTSRVKPIYWKIAKRAIIALPFVWLFPILTGLFVAVGALDLRRNTKLSWSTANRYFFGNGMMTWLLSPLNLFLDLMCLPYRNRGIYRIGDLPPEYKEEVDFLVEYARSQNLADKIAQHIKSERRGMMMFKWYGKNFDTSVPMPEYHRSFQFVQTVGVSAFNKRQSTSLHFGPLRATLRVLYIINDFQSRDTYIDVGVHRHYWADEKLFIFDDTLQHRSVNESDALRVCLFVDVIRPSLVPVLMRTMVAGVQKVSYPFRQVFYKNWSFLK